MSRISEQCKRRTVWLAALFVAAAALGGWPGRLHASTWVYEQDAEAGRSIFVQEEGHSPDQLPIVGQNPVLAPDGRRIAFVDSSPGESWPISLAVTDTEGHGPHNILTIKEPEWKHLPELAWTPDGTGLIATGYGDGDVVELRPVQSQPEWSVTPIISWGGGEESPAISPDGTKIAFTSYINPAGEFLSTEAPVLYIANRNGSSPERLTPKSLFGVTPTFSPDGKKIAFTGWEKGKDTEIYTEKLSTLKVEAITNNSVRDEVPDWRSDGRIGYGRYAIIEGWEVAEFRVIDSNGKNDEYLSGPYSFKLGYTGPASFAAIPGEPITLGPESEGLAKQLLMKYAPKMRFDSQETFRTMTANSITDFYWPTEKASDSNLLRGPSPFETLLAYSNPELSNPHLSLAFLQPDESSYPNEEPVIPGDVLSEHGNSEVSAMEDVDALINNGDYYGKVYGRVKYSGGEWWLQYWFFYYFNPWLSTNVGNHEGDWEMVQLALSSSGVPTVVTYAQHKGGEVCSWSDVQTSIGYYGNVAPDVFVARGSHASYLDESEDMSTFDGVLDGTDAEIPVPVQVEPMDDSMGWVLWPGQWGDSESSPASPGLQGSKWTSPNGFNEEADTCRIGSSPRAALSARPNDELPARSASPTLRAHRRGDQVLVSYWADDLQAKLTGVVITAARSQASIPPTGATFKTSDRRGTVRIPVPQGRGPIVVSGRVLTSDGMQSEPAAVPVR